MLVVQTLQQSLLTELNLLSREDISALAHLLSLAEQILSWDFSHHHILLGEVRFLFYLSQSQFSKILRFIRQILRKKSLKLLAPSSFFGQIRNLNPFVFKMLNKFISKHIEGTVA